MAKAATFALDKMGVVLSCLCMVHCFLTPIIVALYPAFAHGHEFHAGMAIALLLLAAFAFYRGYQVHSRQKVLKFGLAGLFFIFLGLFSPMVLEDTYHLLGSVMTIVGSVFLVTAHFWNIRFARCACCKQAEKSVAN